ncbi:hypothetical protein MGH68_04360 [Erysipelothrix sp. D19-032]
MDDIEKDLTASGFRVSRIAQDGLQVLNVNNMIIIGDNMETDLGQAINVVGAMDTCGFEMIQEVGHIVRKHVKVPRVIAFGGSDVTIDRIKANIITKDGFIGVDAPKIRGLRLKLSCCAYWVRCGLYQTGTACTCTHWN